MERSASSDLPPPTLRVCDPGDLVAAVPYLLGFHPDHSLVVLVMRGTRLLMTARVDLPLPESFADVPGLIERLVQSNDADAVMLMIFTDEPEFPAQWLVAVCLDGLGPGMVRDVLVVDAGHWWSALDGTHGPRDPSAVAAATAVAHGMVALPSREDVGALAAPLISTGADHDAAWHTAALAQLARLGVDHGQAMTALTAAHSGRPDAQRIAMLAILAWTDRGRLAMMRGLDRAGAADAVALWSQVVRHTPARHAAGAMGLLGLAAWVAGDGALQLICAEQTLELAPDDGLAEDLLELNARVIAPTAWDPRRVAGRRPRVPADILRR